MPAMSFADAVRQLREKAGLTQAQVAERAGISTGLASMVETGQRIPSPEIVVRLGAVLGLGTRAQIAFLAVAGYASEEWKDRASEDLREFLGVSTDQDAPSKLDPVR